MSNPANIPPAHQPAFPFSCQGPTTAPEIYYGVSKREYFAAAALIGWGAGRNNGYIFANSKTSDPAYVAESCFKYADAMLAESEGVK